jgi:anti-sigma factor RsiW
MILAMTALAAAFAPPAPVPVPSDVCVAMRKHMNEPPAPKAPGAGRPLSADSRAVLGQFAAAGGANGSAAPNAQAQALLNMMATMFAGRVDAESQAAAAMMRQTGAKPGANAAST